MPNALSSLWDEPAIANRPARSRGDVVLAAAVAAGAVAEAGLRSDLVWPVLGLLFGGALAVAVPFRRDRPLAAVGLGFGGFAAIDVATFATDNEPFVLYSGAVVLVFVFALFRWGSARQAAIGSVAMAAALISTSVVDFNGAGDVVGGAAVLVAVAMLGVSIRYRRAARDQLVEQAKSDERQQIARELHDTVAHHVSAIAVQARAGLVEVDARSFDGAADALQVIADEATRTLTEMRSMVGALRSGHAGQAAGVRRDQPDVADLAARSTTDTRVSVDLVGQLADVSPMVAAAAYRVAQESVTNALRHARHAARIDVSVETTARAVVIGITDDGDAVGHEPSWGYGLTGMGERVGLLGGDFEAGPAPTGGWTVRAVLPR